MHIAVHWRVIAARGNGYKNGFQLSFLGLCHSTSVSGVAIGQDLGSDVVFR